MFWNKDSVWNACTVLMIGFGLVVSAGGNAKADFVFGEPTPLGPTVNTPAATYFNSISADGLELYFASQDNLHVTTRATVDDDWGEPTSLGSLVNSGTYDGGPCLSGDGLSLYFDSMRAGGYGPSDIWVTRRASKNDPWGVPENLGAPVNTSGDEGFPAISSDGLELYFNDWDPIKPGGQGGRDLWMTKRRSVSDTWEQPVNAGPIVNSSSHDIMPSLSPDGLILLFTSHRSGGYGTRDVWMARRGTINDPWGAPVNAGPTINTPALEQSAVLSSDGSTLYFTSMRPLLHIWQAPVLRVVDFNGDGTVDSQDKSILMDHCGQNEPLCDIGPMPWGDGIVDIQDLCVLAEYIDVKDVVLVHTPSVHAVDVPHDTTLEWLPAEIADTHDVYFGTSFEDVYAANRADPRDVLVSQDQSANTFDAGQLTLGQTYYWRIDEVVANSEPTIYKGMVMDFTTESVAYPLENVSATASMSDASAGPENTINGSGLTADDSHSTVATEMWLAPGNGADPVWIQFEFDKVYRLHEMLVWNYNVQFELVLGFGLKDVTVEYSEDGTDWAVLVNVELAQATATTTYTANTTIDLGGAVAKYVRLTVNSGWGMMGQFGLSEVRFFSLPTHAREPQPADGETGVDSETMLGWRAGREAVTHEVYLSTDRQAVVDGTALVDTVTESTYQPMSLDSGQTYYWKINEINGAEPTSVWEGEVWEFTIAD